MKNHKGEIATFLTLSLVVVGTVLTIATSILTNTKKNIASNPRAAGAGSETPILLPGTEGGKCLYSYEEGAKGKKIVYFCNGNLICSNQSENGTCVKSSLTSSSRATRTPTPKPGREGGECIFKYGYNNYYCFDDLVCSNQTGDGICVRPSSTSSSRATRTPTPKPGREGGECIFKYGYNNYYCFDDLVCSNQTGDGICVRPSSTSSSRATNTSIPTRCETGYSCFTNIETCSSVYGSYGGPCYNRSEEKEGICCKPGYTSILTRTPQEAYNCSEYGGTAYQGIGCYDLCEEKGLSYIPNSQGKGSDGQNYCCCKKTEAGQGFDTCYKAYRKGMYGCDKDKNKVVIYARSMSAVGMTNCSAYNKDSTTALYFAQKPGAYKDGGCYAVWDDSMDLDKKNQQAERLLSPTPEPGTEGGECSGLNREHLLWTSDCDGNLICDSTSGTCVRPSPTLSSRATEAPIVTQTPEEELTAVESSEALVEIKDCSFDGVTICILP